MRFIKELLLVYIAVIIQSQWSLNHVFDLLALFSFYLVLRYNWIEGALFAFLGGLLWDSLSGTPLGLRSLALLGSSCLVGFIHSIFFHEHLISRLGMVLTGTIFCLILEWGICALSGGFDSILVPKIISTAFWTSLLAMIIYPILNLFFRSRRMMSWG
jgi:rod shape-determining protein MreD